MTAHLLGRAATGIGPARPIRMVHLGLGNFFRAHQAWFTNRAPDADEWGIVAFGGRSGQVSSLLSAQDGLYSLITRAADGDRFEIMSALSEVRAAEDHDAWLRATAAPEVAVITVTITEAGYCRRDGDLDFDSPAIAADLATLRSNPVGAVHTAPGRLIAGLNARRHAATGPIAIVPCDNLAGNGVATRQILREFADAVEPGLASWIDDEVSLVTTMVDRITPSATPTDVEDVVRATGWRDFAPVVTEPFVEWVLEGDFPAGRPRWDVVGATFTDDAAPYEQRKLWLLNGSHSLLAYLGSVRGHDTICDAMTDEVCRTAVEAWWGVASAHLSQPADEVPKYIQALRERFTNPRLAHRLTQIAADGSAKLPVRIVPVLRAERAAGRLPAGVTEVLAAWTCTLRGRGVPVVDPMAEILITAAAGPRTAAVRQVLGLLGADLADDEELVAAVAATVDRLERPVAP